MPWRGFSAGPPDNLPRDSSRAGNAGSDFLAARIHGRWSKTPGPAAIARLAETTSLAELAASWGAESPSHTSAGLQRWLRHDWTREVLLLARDLGGRGGGLLEWMAARVYVDDLKLRVRAHRIGLAPEVTQTHLIHSVARPLPGWPAPRPFSSLEELARQVPFPPLAEVLRRSGRSAVAGGPSTVDTLERDLDAAYFDELRARTVRVPSEHGERLRELAEVDATMRSSRPPPDESRIWERYARVAWRLLRHDHLGTAALVGYAALRRVAVANAVTLTEAVRLQLPPDRWADRLVPIPPSPIDHA